MRRDVAFALAACAALAACTDAPSCRYLYPRQAPGFALRGKAMDASEVPMLPYNPYWISTDPSLPVVGSAADPCAGQPYHPGRLPP